MKKYVIYPSLQCMDMHNNWFNRTAFYKCSKQQLNFSIMDYFWKDSPKTNRLSLSGLLFNQVVEFGTSQSLNKHFKATGLLSFYS